MKHHAFETHNVIGFANEQWNIVLKKQIGASLHVIGAYAKRNQLSCSLPIPMCVARYTDLIDSLSFIPLISWARKIAEENPSIDVSATCK